MVSTNEFPVAAEGQFRQRCGKKETDIVCIVARDRPAVEFLHQVTYQGHCVIDSAGIGVGVQDAVDAADKARFLPEFPQSRLLWCLSQFHISPGKAPKAPFGFNPAPNQKKTALAVDGDDAGGGDGILIEGRVASNAEEAPTSLPILPDQWMTTEGTVYFFKDAVNRRNLL
jgi:hypothetical protein